MSQLVILGAGGHSVVAAEVAEAMNTFDSIVFLDQSVDWAKEQQLPYPCVGSCDAFDTMASDAVFFVAYGGAELRRKWTERIADAGRQLATLIHPSAVVSPTAAFGEGVIVCAQAVVNARAKLGTGVIVNTAASVDHDCTLDDYVHVCPGARLAGAVSVGTGSWIGIASSVIQTIRIGDNVTVGAGAAVVRDVDNGLTVVGVPAKALKR